jgi:hypothetical protein
MERMCEGQIAAGAGGEETIRLFLKDERMKDLGSSAVLMFTGMK